MLKSEWRLLNTCLLIRNSTLSIVTPFDHSYHPPRRGKSSHPWLHQEDASTTRLEEVFLRGRRASTDRNRIFVADADRGARHPIALGN